jgi:hypothetical protein
VCRLTVHEPPFQTINMPENQSCVSHNRFLYESVQPLPGLCDVFNRKKILYEFDCAPLSKVTCQQENTHAIIVY